MAREGSTVPVQVNYGGSDIKVLAMSSYVRPKVVEDKQKGYVLNGRNNSFYDYVIKRYNGSPTNAAIINGMSDLIYGRGIGCRNAATRVQDWLRFNQIIKPKEIKRVCFDRKLFGEYAFQIVRTKDRKGIAGIYHIEKNLVVPGIENEDGEITSYWYSRDWSNLTKNPPEEFPAFGTGNKPAEIEIYVGKPYRPGKIYFSDPDYLAALPYADLEEELANYYITSIRKGLSAGFIINVPEGKSWTDEQKDAFEKAIKRELTGSPNAMSFILSFNSGDIKIDVTPFPVNENQHKQWQYLNDEARQQLFTGHRIVSPKLFGIMADGGLGNNANELDEAEAQLNKRVVQPYQDEILEGLQEILVFYGINLDLYFKPLTEAAPAVQVSMCEHTMRLSKNDSAALQKFLDSGEEIDLNEYDLVDENEVDYDEEVKFSLASTGTAFPNAKSEQDQPEALIRYRYVGSNKPEREFCRLMMATQKVYRKEDILRMNDHAVNPGWGPHGADTYDIFLYKGGGNCHHKWNRVIYLKKGVKPDVNSPLAELISTSAARRMGVKVPVNDTKVSVEPRNLPNKGFLPGNPQGQ